MFNKNFKLSVAVASAIATSSYAGSIEAPNVGKIEISGDAELKMVQEKNTGETIDKRTAEINLNIDAKADNGLNIYTQTQFYGDSDGASDTQASSEGDTDLSVVHAYATLPVTKKGMLLAGLAPNFQYGTEAFENGGEDWKIMGKMMVASGISMQLVSKIKNEDEKDNNKGDSGSTAIRIDGKFDNIQAGLKYGMGYANKDDGKVVAGGKIDQDRTEKEVDTLTTYLMGSFGGFDIGFEYIQKDVKLVGANKTMKPKGYFVTVGKQMGDFTVGLAYINLEKGMKGGEDFAPGVVLDGNVDSSANKDTSAFVIPIEYDFGNGLSASATYIGAEIEGNDAREIDFGLGYALNDNVELALDYGDFDTDEINGDQRNIELTLAITF